MTTVAEVGQIGRDLVLSIDDLPPAGGSATVRRRQELLGGKGANQAVPTALLVDVVGPQGTRRLLQRPSKRPPQAVG